MSFLFLLLLQKVNQNKINPLQQKEPQDKTKTGILKVRISGLFDKPRRRKGISDTQEANGAVSAEKTRMIFCDFTAIANLGVKGQRSG